MLVASMTHEHANVPSALSLVFTVMMVDREEVCSFHQPEQEEGGSSESLSTQCSESKLIV